jgi:hypothetical protein
MVINRRQSPWKRSKVIDPCTPGPSPPKRTRRSHVSTGLKEKEKVCFVCRKDKYKPDQKNKEKLLPCEHDEVERKIRNAALVRKDNRNITDTQSKDLKTIEFHYHKSCYSSYVNPKVLERLQREQASEKQKASNEAKYDNAFVNLCMHIDESIIKNLEVTSMTVLRKKYISLLKDEGLQVTSYKMERLKNRLVAEYSNKVDFLRVNPNESDYIYNGSLDVKTVLTNLARRKEYDRDDMDGQAADDIYEMGDTDPTALDKETNVYHCGVLVYNLLKEMKDEMPWPPSPEDICEEIICMPDL